jgi:hypothetical protein
MSIKAPFSEQHNVYHLRESTGHESPYKLLPIPEDSLYKEHFDITEMLQCSYNLVALSTFHEAERVCNTYKQNIKLSTGHATSQPVG